MFVFSPPLLPSHFLFLFSSHPSPHIRLSLTLTFWLIVQCILNISSDFSLILSILLLFIEYMTKFLTWMRNLFKEKCADTKAWSQGGSQWIITDIIHKVYYFTTQIFETLVLDDNKIGSVVPNWVLKNNSRGRAGNKGYLKSGNILSYPHQSWSCMSSLFSRNLFFSILAINVQIIVDTSSPSAQSSYYFQLFLCSKVI